MFLDSAKLASKARAIDIAGSTAGNRERENSMTRDRYRVKDDTGNPIPTATFLRRKEGTGEEKRGSSENGAESRHARLRAVIFGHVRINPFLPVIVNSLLLNV